jgi:hypothetical protein
MPTVRLLNSLGKEMTPFKLITIKLSLKKWGDNLKIYNLCRDIELMQKVPVFTTRNDDLFVIQLHVREVDTDYWQSIDDVEVFVTDVTKI